MYTPSHAGLIVEHLFDETLSWSAQIRTPAGQVTTMCMWNGDPASTPATRKTTQTWLDPQVVNIGWLGVQLILANGGSCFLPIRMARSLIHDGQLHLVASAPEFPTRPTWCFLVRRIARSCNRPLKDCENSRRKSRHRADRQDQRTRPVAVAAIPRSRLHA